MRLAFASLVCLAAFTAPATAQSGPEPAFQGAHTDWRVFTRGEGSSKICYALSQPVEALPASVDHGDVFFLVSSWADGAAREQPSFIAGYALKPQTPPRTRVGSDRFTMFVSEQEGFIEQPGDEDRLVRAMRRGASMRVEAMSLRGTATVYEFSLSGVSAALDSVQALCG